MDYSIYFSDSSDNDTNHHDHDELKKFNIGKIYAHIKKLVLEEHTLRNIEITAEIIDIREYKTIIFMKLKDDTENISAVIYKNRYTHPLLLGEKISITGNVEIYRSEIKIYIMKYQKNGTGDDKIKLSQLKDKLLQLGYFDKKNPIKTNYKKIGVISSLNSAGLKDFLYTINERCCLKQIYIYPTSVQGKDAPQEIANAIDLANKHEQVKILVLIRGGGGKEDLECFNSERIATAMFNSKISIVTGIGHQIDTSIADLVCSKSFITPTAVAENITQKNIDIHKKINGMLESIQKKIKKYLDDYYQYIINRQQKLIKYQNIIVTSTNEKYIQYFNYGQNIRKHIKNNIVIYYKYLIDKSSYLQKYLVDHTKYIEDKKKSYRNKLNIFDSNIQQSLNIYRNNIKMISRPRIINNVGEEIVSIENLLKGIYKLCFIDGEYILNIK